MFPIWFAAALAAPPSSTLTGEAGTLSWEVVETAEGVEIRGRSPKWDVVHLARADLSPVRTVRHDADGNEVTVRYATTGAEVTRAGATWPLGGADLWDGDTVDVRLGHLVANGRTDLSFEVVDAASAKTYRMDSALVGREQCGAEPCAHVRVQLAGLLRYVGPTWHYWFDARGRLLRFTGPIGEYRAAGA